MVILVAKNYLKKDRIEEFLKYTEELISETRKEDGCIEYLLVRDSEQENILSFVEKWESMDHLKAHFEAPHFKKVVPGFGDFMEAKGERNIYEKI